MNTTLKTSSLTLVAVAVLAAVCPVAAADLTVLTSGPREEVDSLAQAADVRVVFSAPMVTLGRIPDPVRAPFLSIHPAVPGSFRWSGTSTPIFTPAKPLPFATDSLCPRRGLGQTSVPVPAGANRPTDPGRPPHGSVSTAAAIRGAEGSETPGKVQEQERR